MRKVIQPPVPHVTEKETRLWRNTSNVVRVTHHSAPRWDSNPDLLTPGHKSQEGVSSFSCAENSPRMFCEFKMPHDRPKRCKMPNLELRSVSTSGESRE